MADILPLRQHARLGDVGAVTALVRSGCDINVRDENGGSALHHAIYAKQVGVVEALLGLGADIDAPEQFGGAPLHRACEVEDAETVQVLLRNGADVNRRDIRGRTPLHDAQFKENWTIVELLTRADADWLSEDPSGHGVVNPLHLIFRSLDTSRAAPVREILERVAGESPQAQPALAQCQHRDEAKERRSQSRIAKR